MKDQQKIIILSMLLYYNKGDSESFFEDNPYFNMKQLKSGFGFNPINMTFHQKMNLIESLEMKGK